ncbi:hypothetical protein [Cryobacterium roopkundense]|uniref:Uncharacterized protein n=1 Tax=Cryobacterium roopkundense TaxID=1001240 RepID=A0A7W9E3U4_9MICO|nr:hypothetical protein [Cryobacterium roopkundense]MBB5641992.1 hypothetical protein [Cryobacterium roopkundense]
MTSLIVHLGFMMATQTPGEPDPNTVTPGVVGFFAIAFVGVATVFLGLDMVKRVRRTTYREEIKARLQAEMAERDADTKPE